MKWLIGIALVMLVTHLLFRREAARRKLPEKDKDPS